MAQNSTLDIAFYTRKERNLSEFSLAKVVRGVRFKFTFKFHVRTYEKRKNDQKNKYKQICWLSIQKREKYNSGIEFYTCICMISLILTFVALFTSTNPDKV